MTKREARHPLCGGEWRGPFDTDSGPVEVCNACGEERPADLRQEPFYA